MADANHPVDIPFESFAKLVACLGHPPKYRSSPTDPSTPLSPSKIFASWLNHLPKPFPCGTGKKLFRLLFPHEGARRRYGLKETKLAAELEGCFGIRLGRWDGVSWDDEGGTGCLGREVEIALKKRRGSQSQSHPKSTITIHQVDALLDLLASNSPFSQLSQPFQNPVSQPQILRTLFRESNLSPYAISVLIQVILRDLRPLMAPLPKLRIRNPSALLKLKAKDGPAQLGLWDAMRRWDMKMVRYYAEGKWCLDYCADLVERAGGGYSLCDDPRLGPSVEVTRGPVVGVNVPIPKCIKGRSVRDALGEFYGSETRASAGTVWAETKYDGYRMQIHVELVGSKPRITVYSKSKRNSTIDRLNTHAIVLAALDLPVNPSLPSHPALITRTKTTMSARRMTKSVILEAEVVPYNEGEREGSRGKGIEEFWWLEAAGVTHASKIPSRHWTSDTRSGRSGDRHLCLVFFDILHLDDENLLGRRYEDRCLLLEQTVKEITGFSMIAERTCIPLSNRQNALEALQRVFDRSNEQRHEGLVLKAAESTYTNMQWRWVKLKKDYIPNLGDCIDLVILGAGWDIDRARDLRVDTSVFTTFYIGVLTNLPKVQSRKETPHFEFLFRDSYGMSRDQLEVYNQNIRYGRWKTKSFDRDDPFKQRLLGLSWTYTMPKGMVPPSVLFESPLCGEVMGAGFQKLAASKFYELRWPRLQKIFEPSERSWADAISASELIQVAHKSLGYNHIHPISSPDDSVKALWRSVSHTALTDIPDLSSSSRTPTLVRRKRYGKGYESAPMILKASPPTPVSSGAVAVRSPENLISGERLREVVGSGERCGGMVRTPPRTGSKRAAACEENVGCEKRRRGERLERTSPLFSPLGVIHQNLTPTTSPVAPYTSHTTINPTIVATNIVSMITLTPISSPIKHLGQAFELLENVVDRHGQIYPRKKTKPLSLRARICLAQRKIGVRS